MSKQYLSVARLYAAIIAVALPMVVASGGCISRGAYQQNMGQLADQLQAERAAHALDIEKYDARLRDKNDTMVKLTERFMALQKKNADSQAKLDSLKNDLETLLRDMAELKMVIFHNVKGSEGNEMIIKLMEMQHRVKNLLRSETDSE